MTPFERLKPSIFATESGGDYNALYNYANRAGNPFAGFNLTGMTVDEALEFASPSGPYAQYVKGQVGRVATPMGAYQVVGSTLAEAKKGLGLTGGEMMTEDLQDKIGQWIYKTQGPSAWEGLKGKDMATPMDMAREEELRMQMLASGTAPQAAPRAPLSALRQDRPQAAAAPQQRRSGFGGIMDYLGTPSPTTGLSRAEQFAAALDPLIMPEMRSGEAIRARGAQRQATATKNKTVEYLRKMGYNDYADAVESGAIGSKEIMNALMSQKMGGAGAVRSTKQFSNGTVVQSTDTGVVVYNPQGKAVTGDEAQKVINAANEYELSYAQRLSGGRKLGGISVEAAQDAFEKISLVNNSITNIESALDALEQGAQSGMIYNMIPNVTLASGQLETAMNNMGLDVISSVTFGALSEGEMRLAMETAVPRNLPPEELKKYLQNKKSAQVKAKAALTKAATYLSNPANSLNTWLQEQASRPTPKVEDGQVKVWNQSLNNGAGGFE
jgi:hypothetical protein